MDTMHALGAGNPAELSTDGGQDFEGTLLETGDVL